MRNFRRSIRKSSHIGTTTPAIIEEYHLGYATVRLGNGDGPRMTNLTTTSGTFTAGQRVVVDYSTGTPHVRPLSMEEAAVEVDLDDGNGGESGNVNEDYGVHVFQNQETEPWVQVYPDGIPTNTIWRFNIPEWEIPCWSYDSGNMFNKEVGLYGEDFITIRKDGKYVLNAQAYIYNYIYWETGYVQIEITKNDIAIGRVTTRHWEGENYGPTWPSMTLIEPCKTGDKIRLRQLIVGDDLDDSRTYWDAGPFLVAQWIPGTGTAQNAGGGTGVLPDPNPPPGTKAEPEYVQKAHVRGPGDGLSYHPVTVQRGIANINEKKWAFCRGMDPNSRLHVWTQAKGFPEGSKHAYIDGIGNLKSSKHAYLRAPGTYVHAHDTRNHGFGDRSEEFHYQGGDAGENPIEDDPESILDGTGFRIRHTGVYEINIYLTFSDTEIEQGGQIQVSLMTDDPGYGDTIEYKSFGIRPNQPVRAILLKFVAYLEPNENYSIGLYYRDNEDPMFQTPDFSVNNYGTYPHRVVLRRLD